MLLSLLYISTVLTLIVQLNEYRYFLSLHEITTVQEVKITCTVLCTLPYKIVQDQMNNDFADIAGAEWLLYT